MFYAMKCIKKRFFENHLSILSIVLILQLHTYKEDGRYIYEFEINYSRVFIVIFIAHTTAGRFLYSVVASVPRILCLTAF